MICGMWKETVYDAVGMLVGFDFTRHFQMGLREDMCHD